MGLQSSDCQGWLPCYCHPIMTFGLESIAPFWDALVQFQFAALTGPLARSSHLMLPTYMSIGSVLRWHASTVLRSFVIDWSDGIHILMMWHACSRPTSGANSYCYSPPLDTGLAAGRPPHPPSPLSTWNHPISTRIGFVISFEVLSKQYWVSAIDRSIDLRSSMFEARFNHVVE